MPLETNVAHSITLLLPDGQRVLYECFTAEDCARGFRTPTLIEQPSAFAIRLLHQISTVLIADRTDSASAPTAPAEVAHTTTAKREEALAVMDNGKQASVGGLLATMTNGEYTYNLVPLDHHQSARLQVALHKTSSTCIFPVPSSGLYEVSVWDSQNTPRIKLFLAAIEPRQADAFASYPRAQKLIAEWNADYYGWPVHDLQRAYLEVLMRAPASSKTLAASDSQPDLK